VEFRGDYQSWLAANVLESVSDAYERISGTNRDVNKTSGYRWTR